MALNEEFYDKIVAKIVKKRQRDNLTKFVLSGNEALAAAQRYFSCLKADEKRKLLLEDDRWFVGSRDDVFRYRSKKHTGLSLFKIFASSIIPFIEKLEIVNTHLKDYSFLKDIKHLNLLYLEFEDQEYEKVLLALSSLESVDNLSLILKNLNLQFLSSLTFSFDLLLAKNFTYEADPKCDKDFHATEIHLFGDDELKNDFVFTRENYQKYANIFPNVTRLRFVFFVKIVDNISDLVKVLNPDYAAEVNIDDRNIEFEYDFFDYSGFPESKVVELLQNDENWDTAGCPYTIAFNDVTENLYCSFPLACDDVRKRIANNTIRRIPEGSDGNPRDYYRLIIAVDVDENEAPNIELEVLKTVSVESFLKAVREITGIDNEYFSFRIRRRLISDGTVADNLQDGDTIIFSFLI